MGTTKVGRNDNCPCGTGKKYKRCCGARHPVVVEAGAPVAQASVDKALIPQVPAPTFGSAVRLVFGANEKLQIGLSQAEHTAAQFAEKYCVPSSIPSEQTLMKLEAPSTKQLEAVLARIQINYGRRLGTAYCDSVRAIADNRLHQASLSLRAYLELSGATAYYLRTLQQLLTKGIESQDELDEWYNVAKAGDHGGRFDWPAFFSGGAEMTDLIQKYAKAKSVKDEPSAEVEQKSCATFVAELEKQMTKAYPMAAGVTKTVYAALSDICHPSAGGDFLFAEIPQVAGRLTHRAEPHPQVAADFIRRLALPILVDITQVTKASLKGFQQLADSLCEEASPSVH